MRSRVVLFVVFGLLVVACSRGDRTAVDGPIAASTDETTTSTERLTWPIASFVVPEEERDPPAPTPEAAVSRFIEAWENGDGTAVLRLFSRDAQRLLAQMAFGTRWDWFVPESQASVMQATWVRLLSTDVRVNAVYGFEELFAEARRLGILPLDISEGWRIAEARGGSVVVEVASGDLAFTVIEGPAGVWRVESVAQAGADPSGGGPFLTIADSGTPVESAPTSLRRRVAAPSLEEAAGRFLHAVELSRFEVVYWSLDRVGQGHLEQSLSTFRFREFPTLGDEYLDIDLWLDDYGLVLDYSAELLVELRSLAPLAVEPPPGGSVARAEIDENSATVDVLDADGNHVSTVHLRRGDDQVWRVRQLVAVGAEAGGDRIFRNADS